MSSKSKEYNVGLIVVGSILVFFFSIVMGLFIAFPVMWLWNGFFPVVLGLNSINWSQALCLYVLCSILFKSFVSGGK